MKTIIYHDKHHWPHYNKQNAILIIGDNPQLFNKTTDTTYLIIETALSMAMRVYYVKDYAVFATNAVVATNSNDANQASENQNARVYANCYLIDQTLTTPSASDVLPMPLNCFAAVIMRKDPPFDMEYYYLTQLLSLAELEGARVINNSYSLRNYNEKLSIMNFAAHCPQTLVSNNKQEILDFVKHYKDCVIKPLGLAAGRSVFKLSYNDANCAVIIETITNNYTQTIMVQEFLQEVTLGDARVFIVAGQVIPYYLKRIPQSGQIRSNLAVGGTGEVVALNKDLLEIANAVAAWLQQADIMLAGIDIIGNKLTEINITSPTGARQILRHTKINAAALLLQQLT